MLEILKKLFRDEEILKRVIGLICIISDIVFTIILALKDKITQNTLYAVGAIGLLGLILLVFPKSFSYKKGDTEINFDDEDNDATKK